MTAQEIEIMNAYLDSEGYDIKGLSDSQEAYREDVLITYIKDWLKLTVEVDAVDMVKDFCDIFCAIMVSKYHNWKWTFKSRKNGNLRILPSRAVWREKT